MEVRIHKDIDIEELREIVPIWEELENRFYDVTMFQEVNWLINWWYKKEANIKITPYVVEVKQNNNTVGIVPLYLSIKEFAGQEFRIIRPIGIVDSNYLLPILSKDYPPKILLEKAMNAIYKDRNSWDHIHWGDVPKGSSFDLFLKSKIAGDKNIQIYRQKKSVTPLIMLNNDIELVKNKISKKFLKGLRYYERKLNREGELKYHRVTKKEDIGPIMEKNLQFHKERWRLTDTPSIYSEEPEEREFLLNIVNSFFENDLLHLSYLTHNGTIAAIELGMVTNKVRYLFMGTMNPKFLKYPIGHIIVYKLVKEACEEGYELIDFFRGNEEYKQKWGPKNIANLEYVFFNKSIKSQLFKLINNTYYSEEFHQKSVVKQLIYKLFIRSSSFLLHINNMFQRKFKTSI